MFIHYVSCSTKFPEAQNKILLDFVVEINKETLPMFQPKYLHLAPKCQPKNVPAVAKMHRLVSRLQ